MKPFIKVIAKSPFEKWGKPTRMENDLHAFQKAVGGNIEVIALENVLIICNEEGKILGLPRNIDLPNGDYINGNLVVVGADDEDFTDCPLNMAEWKDLIRPLVEDPCWWTIFYNDGTGRVDYVPLESNAALLVEGTAITSVYGYETDAQKEARRRQNEQPYRRKKYYNNPAPSRR